MSTHATDGTTPHSAAAGDLVPRSQSDVIDMIRACRAQRRQLTPVGTGTSADLPTHVAALSLHQLNRAVDYPFQDMTVTIEAGATLAQLQQILAEHCQRLPIDHPQPQQASIGGLLATNFSGPSRFGHGTLRDYLIGVTAVDGQGREFHAGGRVVKNVAGYDMCKLLIGSRGSLAVITQVTLRVKPLVPSLRFVCIAFDSTAELDRALTVLNTSQTRPVIVEAIRCSSTQWDNLLSGVTSDTDAIPGSSHFGLCLGYEGTEAETLWQVETVQRELDGDDAATVLTDAAATGLQQRLAGYLHGSKTPVVQIAFQPSQLVTVLSRIPATISLQIRAGDGLALLGLPKGDPADWLTTVRQLRSELSPLGAQIWVSRGPNDWTFTDRLGPDTAAWQLQRQLKAALDPDGVLYAEWLLHQPMEARK
ncbi:MAG: FAD-binding oxidoreductase [Planctomycetaceae bacterium]|nr:FAD-binding oxidoreductase [Planctomycetaceae bacterium]